MQKLEHISCYWINYSDETARGDQSGSGNYDGKTLRKGHPNSGLRALAKWLYRLREIDLHGQLAVVEADKLRIRGAIEE